MVSGLRVADVNFLSEEWFTPRSNGLTSRSRRAAAPSPSRSRKTLRCRCRRRCRSTRTTGWSATAQRPTGAGRGSLNAPSAITFIAHPLPEPGWCDPLANLSGSVIRSKSIFVTSLHLRCSPGRPIRCLRSQVLVQPFCVTPSYGYNFRAAIKPVKVVTVTFVYVGGRESVVDRGGYVPAVVGQDHCGVCLDGSVS